MKNDPTSINISYYKQAKFEEWNENWFISQIHRSYKLTQIILNETTEK